MGEKGKEIRKERGIMFSSSSRVFVEDVGFCLYFQGSWFVWDFNLKWFYRGYF